MRLASTNSVARERSFISLILLYLLGFTLAERLEDGLQIDVTALSECSRKTQAGDKIVVHYKGSLEDGTVFDSSYERKEPFSFTLGIHEVITGWDEGLVGMCVGEERKLTIPPALGYGKVPAGEIPPDSTLYFETKLMGIDGVPKETPADIKETEAGAPIHDEEEVATPEQDQSTSDASTEDSPEKTGDEQEPGTDKDGECRLLGPFALIVQAGLGLLAILSLVWKRWRERPRRPLRIWFFDVSKQVFGSALLHGANLLMSMISSGGLDIESKASTASQGLEQDGRSPNPCSFYLINIAVDTTIGIPILVLLLRILHYGASATPLARPKESIKTGHYGEPPRATWWLKQSVLYFIGLALMKLCVFFIFQILPWIAWIGDWALRWTEGSEALQITFVMFVFPLIMNALQYYIIDSFIKEPANAKGNMASAEDDADDGSRQPLRNADDDEGDYAIGRDSDEAKTPKLSPGIVEPESSDYSEDSQGENKMGGSSGSSSGMEQQTGFVDGFHERS